MIKFFFTYCLLLFFFNASAQKEASVWFFGQGVGLNFNQSPPLALYGWGSTAQEGCAIYNDGSGKTLFYTNGISITNRKNEIMKNGISIFGDLSSTNNTVIVPLPGSENIFYLFTIGAAGQSNKGFRYSIIDMGKDSGFGEVVQKNILIDNRAFEKLAAVRHCNNKDVWVTIRISETDEYQTFLVNSSGLNGTPVISHTGLIITGDPPENSLGTLKFSVNGSRLVAAHSFEQDAMELMDFNTLTGVISNPIVFKPNPAHPSNFAGVYGAEFSPDNRLLYVTSTNSLTEPCVLYQFDITSNNAATILASKQTIAQTTPYAAGNLQLGPDKKIYMSMWKDTSVSVIANPDIYGPGCNFQFNKIYMAQQTNEPVQFGFPTFIQSYLDSNNVVYNFSRAGNCSNPDVQFTINRTTGIDSVLWDFGDNQQSKSLAPVHHFNTPGYYAVTLYIYKPTCTGNVDSIQHTIWVAPASFLGNDTASCAISGIQIGAVISGGYYLWNTGDVSTRITVTNAGLYWQEIKQAGCTVRDSINISLKPTPVVNIGNDTSVCKNKSIVFDAGNTATSYLWNNGANTQTITVTKPGLYYVDVAIDGCTGSDTAVVSLGDCEFFIPSAFTPNKDGLNDDFGVLSDFSYQRFSFKIYDRYGHTIFAAKDITQKWDGSYKGLALPMGAYPWIIEYVNNKGEKKFYKGTALLIR